MMLAANAAETPRPRPPAKVRRSTSKPVTSTPPPSYAAAFSYTPAGEPRPNTLLGSPFPATLQRVLWDKDNLNNTTPASSSDTDDDTEWMNEKSREELTELLVKADDLIKERENELGQVSAVCKTLYDNNVAIKSKHQALLARLPSSPSRTPSPEPLPSRYSISLSRPVSDYNTSPLVPNFKSHARKISVSTSEISHLADQNAELLEKLEKLESDSFSADQSGRRELKRLEKEISALREELEKTQAKSEELEEKAKAGFAWDSEKVVQAVLRKKSEREERFRAMRNLGQGLPSEYTGDSEIRDFAPESSFYPPGDTPRRPSGTPYRHPLTQTEESAPTTQPEPSLISQLLQKIQELEQTNTRIIEQQTETTNQLNLMQRETEHMTRVYECFADENLIELADDHDEPESVLEGAGRSPHDDTIQFRSFKRNLGTESDDMLLDDLSRGSSHPRSVSRNRKSVMGLFDRTEEKSEADQHTFGLPVPFTSSPCSDGLGTARSISTGLLSPALSTLSLSSQNPGADPFNNKRPTLQAELENQLGDNWDLNTSHLRKSSSLYDFGQASAAPSPSPSPARLPHSRYPSQEQQMLSTPQMAISNSIMQLSVEPPTPEGHKHSASKQTKRYHLMSETIRSRTNRWVDGRLKSPDAATRDNHTIETKQTSAVPVPQQLVDAFDAAVENFTRRKNDLDDEHSPSNEQTGMSLRAKKQPRGLAAIMLEIWLWLQFALIILVFLWAMAKRGPKSVLGTTRHRRVSSTS